MRKYYLLFFLLAFKLTASAQVDTTSVHVDSAWINPDYKEASPESQAYHDYRLIITKPPYGLQKIINLISKLKMDDNEMEKIPDKTYASLSFREKFTYHMIHEEAYSQICDAMPPIQDEQKKIFAQTGFDMEEREWSERQIKFFNDNRDSVIKLMSEIIVRSKHVGLNFKDVIVEIKAKEMIPLLINTYNFSKKDHDILTVLMLLMKDNNYQPFLSSTSYKKLYGEVGNYEAYLNYNKANEELIIKRAADFYNGVSK
jgi:hypothetical protein